MADLFHYWNNDLVAGADGDLLAADGTVETPQRILRRLMSNPGDYIWDLLYGAGLPAKIGDPVDVPGSQAIIASQLLLEEGVARNPQPTVNVTPQANGASARLRYNDALSATPQAFVFDINS